MTAQSVKNLEPTKFKSSFDDNEGIILDVRTSEELINGIIENASTIDYYDVNFTKKVDKIQKNKIIYVYCRSGGRSSKAAEILIDLGYHF